MIGQLGDTMEPLPDPRIARYIEIIEQFIAGSYAPKPPAVSRDEIGQLGMALQRLGAVLEIRECEIQSIDAITRSINSGLLLDDILDNVYESFHGVIPYNRIGFSLIENNQTVRAYWLKTDQPVIHLGRGYSARLKKSSLNTIIETGQPRIINDLAQYLENKPSSESTRLIVAEGIRSSLTCPLIAKGKPIGFIFFSSIEPGTYNDVHVETFQKIAAHLSIIVEKGQLTSALAEHQKAIERQNEELSALNDLKSKFLGIAAHDLRNPISTIQMASMILGEPPPDLSEDEHRFLVEDIDRQASYMLNLIDDLLDVSQIESGYLELRLEQLPLRQLLADAVRRHANLASAKRIEVLLSPCPDSVFCADPLRLRQVIDNLISNAVKYSRPGGTVVVQAAKDQGAWKISVRDEGPGIDPGDKERLFQYFSRLSTRPTGGEKSTGLGLAISRRIVEAHRGQIGVESEMGKGSIFWFTLPDDLSSCE
jgi:signal transduction histidine kinase